jgi:hypothetical protein
MLVASESRDLNHQLLFKPKKEEPRRPLLAEERDGLKCGRIKEKGFCIAVSMRRF